MGLGLDMYEDEDVNTLNEIMVKAHQKEIKEFWELMRAWDNWNEAT